MTYIQSILIMFVGLICVQNDGWKFEFEKEGITVYTKHIEGFEFKAFKGEITINATVDELLTIIYDVENYPNWCYKTSSTKLLKKEGNKIYYYYLSETPPLISDREAYFCSEVFTDSSSSSTLITMKIYDSKEPVPKGMVRMPFSDGLWKFTPIDEKSTRITFQMHADPGGKIPAWLANLASVDSPWITLDNLRKIIQNKSTN